MTISITPSGFRTTRLFRKFGKPVTIDDKGGRHYVENITIISSGRHYAESLSTIATAAAAPARADTASMSVLMDLFSQFLAEQKALAEQKSAVATPSAIFTTSPVVTEPIAPKITTSPAALVLTSEPVAQATTAPVAEPVATPVTEAPPTPAAEVAAEVAAPPVVEPTVTPEVVVAPVDQTPAPEAPTDAPTDAPATKAGMFRRAWKWNMKIARGARHGLKVGAIAVVKAPWMVLKFTYQVAWTLLVVVFITALLPVVAFGMLLGLITMDDFRSSAEAK